MTTLERPPVVEALEVDKSFHSHGASKVHAVNHISLAIRAGETLGLIGESGSGKSTLGKLLLGLLEPDSGDVTLDGESIVHCSERELRRRRTKMQVVFQEPYESLNPRMRIRSLIAEPLVVQDELSSPDRRTRVAEVMEMVGLNQGLADRFPGELSGGQQQRVGIARAIVGRPRLVVLDEPTASLDRTIRRQITDLLMKIQVELDLAYLLITHDIASVRRMATRSAVMFRGHIVESGPTRSVLTTPGHPYTKALVSAELPLKVAARSVQYRLKPRLASDIDRVPSGCPLSPICPLAIAECDAALPPLLEIEVAHDARCIRWPDVRNAQAVTIQSEGPA